MNRKLIMIAALLSVFALIGTWLGILHPLGDTLAIFRGPLSIICVLSAIAFLILRHYILALFIFAFALISLSTTFVLTNKVVQWEHKLPYCVYQKNLSFRNNDYPLVVSDIQANEYDFIMLQEVSSNNKAILDVLLPTHPNQHYCDFAGVGGVAVLSQLPVVKGTKGCVEKEGVAYMQVETPDGLLWVVSVHLHWPWPHQQAQSVQKIMPTLAAMKGDKLIGGDFNMVPWSYTLHHFQKATNTTNTHQMNRSFPLFGKWFVMPIDHILIPKKGKSHRNASNLQPLLGSDHYGVITCFDF